MPLEEGPQPINPEKAGDIPAVGDVKDSHTDGIEDIPAGGIAECGTVTVTESIERAPAVYSTRFSKTSREAKEIEGPQKKLRMTEVEKPKKDNDDPKKQKVLRGGKEKVETLANPQSKEGNQQNTKGKQKKHKKTSTIEEKPESDSNMNAVYVQETKDLEFKKGDPVRLKGLEEDEEHRCVARGKVQNVAGASLHGKPILPGLVSVEVIKSLDDNYNLFASKDLDDPPVTLVGQAIGHFVLWPTKFMEIDLTF